MPQKLVAYSFPTTLSAPLAIDGLSMTLTNVGTPYTPTLAAGEYVYAMISTDEFFSDTAIDYETVKVTAIDSGTKVATIERNAESTDGAKVWDSGAYVMFGDTAIGQQELIDAIEKKYSPGVGNVTSFTAAPVAGYDIELTWGDPDDFVIEGVTIAEWAGTKVLRKTGSYPADETDGTLVVDSTTRDQYESSAFTDTGLGEEVEYFYMAFPYTTQDVYTVDASNRDSATTLDKSPQSAPAAPSVTAIGFDTATVTGDTSGEGDTQVRLNDGAWQTNGHTFIGLDPETEYTAYARYNETAAFFASDPSTGAEFTTAYVTGIRWVQSTDTVTRLDDADTESMTRADFDDIAPWSGMRRCMVNDDGTINYYIDPTTPTEIGEVVNTVDYTSGNTAEYDGTHGQVMVEIPKFWYKSDNSTSGTYDYWVTSHARSGFDVHPAFIRNEIEKDYIYFSAFEGFYSSTDGAMQSVADVVPSTSDGTSDEGFSPVAAYPAGSSGFNGGDIRNCRYWAQERGTGWEQQDFLTTCALQLLYIIEYADWDTQSTIGKGVVDKVSGTNNRASKTGATISLGNASGRESGTDGLTAISYRGVENFWGNIWKWVDGINVTGSSSPTYTAYVADHSFESDKTTSPYASIGTHVNTSAAWGNINNIAFNDGYSFLGSSVSGTSYASHLHDGFYTNTTGRVARFGGYWSHGSLAGGFCWNLFAVSSGVSRLNGARLLFIG
jgi:hypothetical protein